MGIQAKKTNYIIDPAYHQHQSVIYLYYEILI